MKTDLELIVFQLDNQGTFEPLGEINKYTSLSWPDKYRGYSNFELHAPVNDENRALIQKGNILWAGGDNAAVIEIIYSSTDTKGQKTYTVKGRTLEMLLTTRIIWGTYNATNKYTSTRMYEIVLQNCVNPTDSSRKIPFLECAEDELLGSKLTYQKTGGEVYAALESMATEDDLGFTVLFKPIEKKLVFKVLCGVDRSNLIPEEGDPFPVLLSTDLEDILSSEYYTNNQEVKNIAYVAGEDSGESRKKVIIGEESFATGFNRRELYVDARDIQSEVYNDEDNTSSLTEQEYLEALGTRGAEKLAECDLTETFDIEIRITGGQYTYGVDYFKGDKVVAQDLDLGIQVVGQVTEAHRSYGSKQELSLTFGYSYPTLLQKIKQQIS